MNEQAFYQQHSDDLSIRPFMECAVWKPRHPMAYLC